MPRRSKLVVLALAPLGALALAGGHTGAAAALTHHPRIPAGQATKAGWLSSNWSGYALSGGTGAFHSITGKWTVTKVGATSSSTYSSSWIGIDGYNNSDLIQTGTEADYYGGAAHYDAWWEILPAPETVIPSITVHPGDHMTASITKGTTWTITITDTTTGQTFTTKQAYTGPGTSAEWIQEAPQVNGVIAKLAHYGTVKFDPGTVNGVNPNLNASESGIMVQGGKHVSTPSNPDSDTDGFNVKYGATQPSPPSS